MYVDHIKEQKIQEDIPIYIGDSCSSSLGVDTIVLTPVNEQSMGVNHSPPEFGVDDANASCPPDLKNTAQNSPKEVHFFWGEPRSNPMDPRSLDPTSCPNQAFTICLCSRTIPARFTPVEQQYYVNISPRKIRLIALQSRIFATQRMVSEDDVLSDA